MAARIDVTAFCSGTKPADAPPTGDRYFDRAHRAVGQDQRATLDPLGLQQRLRFRQPRGLDDDVGALDATLPIGHRLDRLAEIGGEPGGKAVAAFRPARMDTDLVEVEEVVEQPHVPVGRAARADMGKHLRIPARQMPGADRGDGAGAHVGDNGGV